MVVYLIVNIDSSQFKVSNFSGGRVEVNISLAMMGLLV